MRGGWLEISTCPTVERKEDARVILVWHVFLGCMVATTRNVVRNRFFVYWRELPAPWIDIREQIPIIKDADTNQCVLIQDKYGKIRLKGIHQENFLMEVVRWQRMPEPPEDYQKIRKECDL